MPISFCILGFCIISCMVSRFKKNLRDNLFSVLILGLKKRQALVHALFVIWPLHKVSLQGCGFQSHLTNINNPFWELNMWLDMTFHLLWKIRLTATIVSLHWLLFWTCFSGIFFNFLKTVYLVFVCSVSFFSCAFKVGWTQQLGYQMLHRSRLTRQSMSTDKTKTLTKKLIHLDLHDNCTSLLPQSPVPSALSHSHLFSSSDTSVCSLR